MRRDPRNDLEAEMFDVCESPIERALLHAMIRHAYDAGFRVDVGWQCPLCMKIDRALGGDANFGDRSPRGYCCDDCCGRVVVSYGKHGRRHTLFDGGLPGRLHIELQPRRGPYRLDLAIDISSANLAEYLQTETVAIECDGHNYHSSREQRTRDAARDRYLNRHGVRVLRFTGTEIWRDPARSAREAIEVVRSRIATHLRWDDNSESFVEARP